MRGQEVECNNDTLCYDMPVNLSISGVKINIRYDSER
jgi:hypothetical protein